MDFTLSTYKHLLKALQAGEYSFQTFADFINHPQNKAVVMRHDVDKLPGNALRMAELEQEMGIHATYYFRAVGESFDRGIMAEIAGMGHEMGYHYESVDAVIRGRRTVPLRRGQMTDDGGRLKQIRITVGRLFFKKRTDSGPEELTSWKENQGLKAEDGGQRTEGRGLQKKNNTKSKSIDRERLIDLGYEDFGQNLDMFREHFDVKTICMHGSPLSRYDNRMIWEKYDYRELGIVAEPYFDVDYNEVFYVTDTGRKWNRESSSVRDKVASGFDIEVKSTKHLIELAREKRTEDRGRRTAFLRRGQMTEDGRRRTEREKKTEDRGRRTERVTRERKIELPDRIMINVHPQRWNDRPLPWLKELVGQNVKNVAKKMLIRFR